MKKIVTRLLCPFLFAVSMAWPHPANAQFTEIIKAIIKAADIAVQKAQNATIELQNVQKQIENALSESKLADIAQWVQKQKDLYQDYFQELWQVKTVIAGYKRVTTIIDKQKKLVADYKRALSLLRQDSHFTPDELSYIEKVYAGIIDESVKNLDQLLDMITAFTVQMSDADRLSLINGTADGIDRQNTDLRKLTDQLVQISLQRSENQTDWQHVRQLYGL